MKWLLFSDLCPLALVCLTVDPDSISPTTMAVVVSRACSCAFHVMQDERWPYLINLDHIGLSFMVLASLDACDRVRPAFRMGYICLMLALWCASLVVHGVLWVRRAADARVVLALAFVGHYPAMYAVAVGHPHALRLGLSMCAFALGYFVVESRIGHVYWHWVAFVGQALLLFI